MSIGQKAAQKIRQGGHRVSLIHLLWLRLIWALFPRRMKRDLWECLRRAMFPQMSLTDYLNHMSYLDALEQMPDGESLRMFNEACEAAWRAVDQAQTSPRGLWSVRTWARMMQNLSRHLGHRDLSQASDSVRWALLLYVSSFYLDPRGEVTPDEAARALGVASVSQIFALYQAIPTHDAATLFIAHLPLKPLVQAILDGRDDMRPVTCEFWGDALCEERSQ